MCRDCRVLGGTRAPCWTNPVEGNPHGYPCPRREWPDDDSAALGDLARFAAHRETAHLFELGWRINFGERAVETQRRLFNRMLCAHGDKAIASVFWPREA